MWDIKCCNLIGHMCEHYQREWYNVAFKFCSEDLKTILFKLYCSNMYWCHIWSAFLKGHPHFILHFCVRQVRRDITDVAHAQLDTYLSTKRFQTNFFRCFCVMTTHIFWRPHFSAICIDFITISITMVDIPFRRVETSKSKVWMDAVLYKNTIIFVAPLFA